jgi:hypothetical protein
LKRAVKQNILVAGQHIQGVFPLEGEDGEVFFYTIGNAERGLPELFFIGRLRANIAALLLNEVGQYMRERGKPIAEGMLDLNWTFPFKIRKAGGNVRTHYTIQVGQYLGHEQYDVLQIMICDEEGRYPGDEGCELDISQP